MNALTAVTSSRNSYVNTLNATWKDHLSPRGENAPTVISTFAGCGGSSLGYSMAGYRELAAVEWDDHAVATFQQNFPDVPVYHGDITDLTSTALMDLAGIAPGELDVFDGSPPCQGFSTSGNRILTDPRNQLFLQYTRLLNDLQPRVFVMENVAGMVKGKMKLVFAEIMRTLKACGYQVETRLLDAKWFNVPQSRPRLIFIGLRNDLPSPVKPLQDERQPEDGTASQATHDLETPASTATTLAGKGSEVWNAIKPGQKGSDAYNGSFFAHCKLHPDQPSPTLLAQSAMHYYHWNQPRSITIPEAKRLASFPDLFTIEGSKTACFKRIGNSVPPLFMRAIAAHIREHLLGAC